MYGITTAAEAKEMLQDMINKLGEAAGRAHANPFSAAAMNLPDAALEVAFWRGYAETFTAYERTIEDLKERGFEGMQLAFAAQAFLTRRLGHGPDDNASGRGNDARRRHYDGVLDAVSELGYVVNRIAEEAVRNPSAIRLTTD